ncbi:MAG: hypothetical protein U9Q70_02055 [Chloroflexota bacterium]|nr:hypothetical protein [Chloroflexota bacterium]
MENHFEVGKKYRNNLGEYEVISIDGPAMTILQADGRIINSTVNLQARIWKRVRWEKQHKKQVRASRRSRKQRRRKAKFPGFKETDFQGGVKGTSWRARNKLAGLIKDGLTAKTRYEFQSYAVYGQPVGHYVIPEYYDKKHRGESAKFVLDLNTTRARYGFHIKKGADIEETRANWQRLIVELAEDTDLQQEIVRSMQMYNLRWDLYPDGGEETPIHVVVAEDGQLCWQTPETTDTLTWGQFIAKLEEISASEPYNIYLCAHLKKEEAIAKGAQLADSIVGVYRSLLLLYEISTRCAD